MKSVLYSDIHPLHVHHMLMNSPANSEATASVNYLMKHERHQKILS
jgi:hypothetical protein